METTQLLRNENENLKQHGLERSEFNPAGGSLAFVFQMKIKQKHLNEFLTPTSDTVAAPLSSVERSQLREDPNLVRVPCGEKFIRRIWPFVSFDKKKRHRMIRNRAYECCVEAFWDI